MTDRLYDFAGLSASLDEALVAVLGESGAAAGETCEGRWVRCAC